MQQLEFNLTASLEARDAGMIVVAANSGSWFDTALAFIERLPPGWTGLGEDIRDAVERSEVGPAHSKNAWGSLIGFAKRRGLIELTGVRRPMRAVKSHARTTDEYRRVSI
jgi:hypothetical protein